MAWPTRVEVCECKRRAQPAQAGGSHSRQQRVGFEEGASGPEVHFRRQTCAEASPRSRDRPLHDGCVQGLTTAFLVGRKELHRVPEPAPMNTLSAPRTREGPKSARVAPLQSNVFLILPHPSRSSQINIPTNASLTGRHPSAETPPSDGQSRAPHPWEPPTRPRHHPPR
jgi:hypothetical protein